MGRRGTGSDAGGLVQLHEPELFEFKLTPSHFLSRMSVGAVGLDSLALNVKPAQFAAACESAQKHVVILVRNEGQSLDQGNMW